VRITLQSDAAVEVHFLRTGLASHREAIRDSGQSPWSGAGIGLDGPVPDRSHREWV